MFLYWKKKKTYLSFDLVELKALKSLLHLYQKAHWNMNHIIDGRPDGKSLHLQSLILCHQLQCVTHAWDDPILSRILSAFSS